MEDAETMNRYIVMPSAVKIKKEIETVKREIYVADWTCPNCDMGVEDERGAIEDITFDKNGAKEVTLWLRCPRCDYGFRTHDGVST